MILLDSALCSKNFRKVGIIHSSVNLFCQGICLLLLTIYCISIDDDRLGYRYVYYRNWLMVLLFFVLIDMVLYSLLIYGLATRKPALLLLWLSFAPLEFITVVIFFLIGVYGIVQTVAIGIGLIALIACIVFVTFMFHNMCIVLSARHGFIQSREPQNINLPYQPINTIVNTTDNTIPFGPGNSGRVLHIPTDNSTALTIMTNSSPPSYEQCNTQHYEYNPANGQYIACKCINSQLLPN